MNLDTLKIIIELDEDNRYDSKTEFEFFESALFFIRDYINTFKQLPRKNVFFKNDTFDNFYINRYALDIRENTVNCYVEWR